MKDILFLLSAALVIYIISRIILREPLLPWKEKKQVRKTVNVKKKKGKNDEEDWEETPALPFRELFSYISDDIENHMIRHKDNTFTMMAEVEPVNYFLLDQDEQESIDSTFETWLSQLTYPVRIYLQNRFVDLTSPIKEIQTVMESEENMHPSAYEFGENMINNLLNWQNEQPRYETKRYLLFDYQVDSKDIKAENEEEFEEKVVDKAFNELYRRLSTARSQLRKADMDVQLLTTDGIVEVLYYGFNRRKARKNQYRHVSDKEQLALYTTSDQSLSQMVRVKGEIERVQKESIQKEQATEEQPTA